MRAISVRFGLILLLLWLITPTLLPAAAGQLVAYFIDVEGGQATLFVTPEHRSLLVDTGWPDAKSAERIVSAAHEAGVQKLDYVLITHYHVDHVGGVPELASRIPIGTFIDHGPNREADAVTQKVYDAYQRTLSSGTYRHIVVAPGDSLPIEGVGATVVSADGNLLQKSLSPSASSNPLCSTAARATPDQTENARSVGILLTYSNLRILDLGDLTADKEAELACPSNKLGKVDIFVVSHHGWYQSNSELLVKSISSRVAIMDNGARKGGSPSAWSHIQSAAGLEDLWQLHYSEEGGTEHNVAERHIANLQGPDSGNWIRLTANQDGSFDIFNSRTKESKHYPARKTP